MRLVLTCPIPLEYSSCRTALLLRDAPSLFGCRVARGMVGDVDIMAVETGPAKARAAASTMAAVTSFEPDLVADTGTCGALDGDLIVNTVVLGLSCLEYDISGYGMPHQIIPEMKLPSFFELVARADSQRLVRSFTELGRDDGIPLRSGIQACGEFLLQSTEVRESLHAVSGAAATSWETAGVFVAALRARIPPLSIRIVSDLGDEDALRDFRRNARRCSQRLYRLLGAALESGWFSDVHDQWKKAPRTVAERLPSRVLP